METIQVTRYRSRDGQEFDSESECKSHERRYAGTALVGLSIEEIEAARSRTDPDLADAFEAFAGQIRRARVAAGHLKRKPNRKAEIDITGTTPIGDVMHQLETPMLATEDPS